MQKWEKTILLIMSICFLIISGIILNGKQNLAEDEVFSYGSSNHQGFPLMEIEDGVTYERGETPFEDYVFVRDDGRFQYGNVWRNQSIDIHPPFYYALLHTICSLFPGTFSIWYAGIINMVFAVLILWLVYAIAREFETERNAALLICGVYVLTAGIYQACTFFRMYVVAMFFCTLLCWLHIRWYNRGCCGKEYLYILAASAGGVLTHYFVIVFVVVEAVVYGIVLLTERKYKAVLRYAAAMCAAAVTSLLLYPAMLEHIFGRYRGKEAVENARNMEDIGERWLATATSVSGDVWGNFFWLILCAAVFCLVMYFFKHKKNDSGEIKRWLILFIPTVMYTLIISKISSYISSRYIFPVYAVWFIIGCLILWNAVKFILPSWKKYVLFGAIAAVMAGNGFRICRWQFSYQDDASAQALEAAKKYQDRECLYVYQKKDIWAVQSSYFEIREYESVTFLEEQNLDILFGQRDYADGEGLVVYIEKACDEDAVLNKIRDVYGESLDVKKVAEAVYTNTYLCE